MTKLLTKVGMLAIISGCLVVLGNLINSAFSSYYWFLTLFKIFRTIIMPLDYLVDIPEFIADFGIIISLFVGFWSARASILFINYFNK